ncbi:uncharacterized protein F5Z01DRAFT_672160 [Emericellopsis atlantica]|uniref:DUF6923 domain-containing protein n=1 Tax=Emericellopsis atlantica TaxID=2614577 RepID=A0A9P8CS75_9HYPO|nr:uncharacterized protein F5Z01DRAFT_672160 [Emericellopsis atlantica]KAG9256935.1 hypothetical protein F5Z01DRAFT_672160 [Emericellopsis atlantica]
MNGASNRLIRINSDGDSTTYPLNLPGNWRTGDVDSQGHLWVALFDGTWAEIDVDQQSPTFGTVLSQGDGTGFRADYTVADWAFVPGGGPYTYAIIYQTDGDARRARFNTLTGTWDPLESYGQLVNGSSGCWGAVYSSGGGNLYASENNTGEIWRFPIVNGGDPEMVVQGPVSSNNDGARCVLAPDPAAPSSTAT